MDLPTIPISSKRILVVDSDEQVRRSIVRVLEIDGYTVYQANHATLAYRFLQQLRPDLIIADINTPNAAIETQEQGNLQNSPIELNNSIQLSFYQAVRNHPAWTTIPFILLTQQNNEAENRRVRLLGGEDFLTKPVDLENLVRIVHTRLLRSIELQVALIDQAYLDTIEVLANTVEGRDPYTHGHIGRVSTYAMWLAEALSWPKEQMRYLAFGSRLHDIGKIVVPDHILNKPGKLDQEEWELMKQHPSAGGKILRQIKHLNDALNYVLYHHERWDGSGYPHGLSGRDIPIEGRLLALVDVYDALTTVRPYHPARPHDEVLQYLVEQSGIFFDPDLTQIFVSVIDTRLRN